jgi:hypothetical protein
MFSARKIDTLARNLHRTLVKTNWEPVAVQPYRSGILSMLAGKNWMGILVYCISLGVGVLSVIGLARHGWRLAPIMLPSLYFLLLLNQLASEERRMLPASYFLVPLAYLGCASLLHGVSKTVRFWVKSV